MPIAATPHTEMYNPILTPPHILVCNPANRAWIACYGGSERIGQPERGIFYLAPGR